MNNKFLLAILTFFILAMSASCVSAEDVANIEDANIAEVDVATIAAIDTDAAVLTDEITEPQTYDVNPSMNNSAIQEVINNANAGDTIRFEQGEYYNVDLSVDKTLHFVGAGSGVNGVLDEEVDTILYGLADAEIFNVAAGTTTSIAGTSFENIAFVFADPDAPWNGRAIEMRGGENVLIDSCSFFDGNAGIYLRGSVGNLTITNNYFTGTTNQSSIDNDGTDEEGTKAINVMGGSGVTIANNIFAGDLLDGASIASGASNILVEGNEFINNTYAIFFGGGLQGIVIQNNVFYNTAKQSVNLMKSSSNTQIINNEFIANEGDVIYLQQGNTAHGAPTTIGNLIIDNNVFEAVEGTDADDITAVYIESQGGPLEVSSELSISGNTIEDGIKLFEFFDMAWSDGENITIIPNVNEAILVGSNTTIVSSIGNRFEILLKDEANQILANQQVTFTINGVSYNRTTDENGVAGLNINLNAGQYPITVAYAGSTSATPVTEEYVINVEAGKTRIFTEDVTITERGTAYTVQVVDENDEGISGAVVAFHINGVAYYKSCDENGYASLNINLGNGVYNMYISYDGTLQYQGCTAGSQITVAA